MFSNEPKRNYVLHLSVISFIRCMKGVMSVPKKVLLTHSTDLERREKVSVMHFWSFTTYLLQHWYIKNLKICWDPFSSIGYLSANVSTWLWHEDMYRVIKKFLHTGTIFASQTTVLTYIHFCCAADFLSISTKALSSLIAVLRCYFSVETVCIMIKLAMLSLK